MLNLLEEETVNANLNKSNEKCVCKSKIFFKNN